MGWLCFVLTISILKIIPATAYNPYKLPHAVVPYHYNIHLKPDIYNKTPNEFVLYGNVEIDAKVEIDTNNVTLHSENLTLGDVSIFRNQRNIYKSQRFDNEKQWFVFSLTSNLRRGDQIKIKIEKYQSPIVHALFGLYYYSRRESANSSTARSYGVTTQLEATYARRVFPCFDEPAFKATFSISIARKKPFYSLSNMPVIRREEDPRGEWIVDHFDKTPKMSTYLVAAIVTKYKGLTEMHRDVNFTIYYPQGKENAVQFAMRISKKVFDSLEDYFDVKFPIPKLDQIGFSRRDYHFGGMENYGMITYNDNYLYTFRGRKDFEPYIAGVVLHEITHQWFGNLVTMRWWDDLWLNEGMTEFFSFLRGKWISKYKPKDIGTQQILRAMSMETRRELLPVYVPWAKSPEEIISVINPVTYTKGGMILKMAELIMGETVFQDAMRFYIKSNKFGSVTHNDLWRAFTLTNKKHGIRLDMKKILSPWLKQPGFPVVNVTINHRAGTLHYEQGLFYKTPAEYDSQMPKPSIYRYKWPLPIQWMTGNKGKSNISVSFKTRGTIKLQEKLYPTDWLIVNPEANFYYIVNYERSHWRKLGEHLRKDYQAFDRYTRTKIIYDVFQLFHATKSRKGDYMDAATANAVLSFAEVETDTLPKLGFWNVFNGPLKDRGLKPTYDILKRRNIL